MKRQELGSAILSDCGRFRYELTRSWGPCSEEILWILLNPSTADAEQDDPTLRRVVGFTKRWGYERLRVVNLFALRSKVPQELVWKAQEPPGLPGIVGPDNDRHLAQAAQNAARIIAGWGSRGSFYGRDLEVLELLRRTPKTPATIWALGTNAGGEPRHPLYTPARMGLERFASLAAPVRRP